TRAQNALAAEKAAVTVSEKTASQAAASQSIQVELVFNQQITQSQIDRFTAQGGQIDYVYKAVSYGWNGRIPLRQVPAIPAAMGASFRLIEEAKPARWHMDAATRSGRVRPIWAA